MISKLELAWETYEFYTNEIIKYEEIHMNTLKTLKRFVNENVRPKKYQRDRVKKNVMNLVLNYFYYTKNKSMHCLT